DGIRDRNVTGVQTCALPILASVASFLASSRASASSGSGWTWEAGSVETKPAGLLMGVTTVAENRDAGVDAAQFCGGRRESPWQRSEERRVGKECGAWRGREE